MRLVIAGASGFIGSMVVKSLSQQRHALTRLMRQPLNAGQKDWIVWQPGVSGEWELSPQALALFSPLRLGYRFKYPTIEQALQSLEL